MDDELFDEMNENGELDDEELFEGEKSLLEMIEADEQRVALTNVPRLKQMQLAYKAIERLFASQKGVSVKYSLNKPFNSFGSISVEGAVIDIENAALFGKINLIANNVEIYPLTNGRIRMAFGFHNLTSPIE